MDDFERKLISSLQTGFINKAAESQDDYQPQLVTNNLYKQKTVLSTLQRELSTCKAFYFSVAFVTKSGLCGLLNTLVELQKNNIRGKILVSQYQNITQPHALRQLLKLTNIELRIAVKGNHHAKGYIFEQDYGYSMLVGSSNLTSHALKSNNEWNLKLTSAKNGKLVEQTIAEFWDDFNNAVVVDKEFIAQYELVYQTYKKSNYTFHQKYYDVPPKPNKMQMEALSNLESLRKNGHTKGLLVSATGTGKIYLSAFDAQKVNPQRLLFVVHRANIANAAMETYQKVFKQTRSMGMYSGQNHDTEADFLFATIQTISRNEHLSRFAKDHFDYIVIDETHRAGAKSYLKIMEYFQPKFLLGLTATPERTDGFNIFKEFDHNIVYEIRLHRAMSEGMLCDFHYYGIADIFTEQDYGDDISFDMLVAEERVKHIIDKIKFYGCDSNRTCGLIFCSSNEESKQLSAMFNMQGFRTKYLTGQSSEDERTKAIEQLESDDANSLDYIFTRDIFNEGIDIPCVNQIIMLRPTQSAIIFVQQLGRGLRKYPHKEYLTVLDFIGNYSNNFFIPIALFGDTSYNKDSLRKMMVSASCVIPGTSTVNFEHIVKQKIFSAIDKAKLSQKKDLRKDYEILKFKIGRVPMMMDFFNFGSRDAYSYVARCRSYYNFVQQQEKVTDNLLDPQQVVLIELFSKEIANSKRIEEVLIMKSLLQHNKISFTQIQNLIHGKYGVSSIATLESCLGNLNFEFAKSPLQIVKLNNKEFSLTQSFKKHLGNATLLSCLQDVLDYAESVYDSLFVKDLYRNGFVLYRKYSRKDVCRILNWEHNEESTVYGYKIKHNTCPMFVNYHKEEGISDSTKYNDHFINRHQFEWMSKSNRYISSAEIQSIIHHDVQNIRLSLFVKKSNDEGAEFYYMGDVKPISYEESTVGTKPVVKFRLLLDTPVEQNIYDYITNN